MGLGLHYKGKIRDAAMLPALIEEIKDIAQVHNWKIRLFEESLPAELSADNEYENKIYGISFTPPSCETVSFCFLSNGRISGPLQLKFFGKYDSKEEAEYLYSVSVKTQFAGFDTHVIIVDLFRYLSQRYFSEFTMTDEGKYWETGDKRLLAENFEKYTKMLNNYTSSVESFPMQENENLEAYMNRLVEFIQRRAKK
jgi:hypothetical protein